MKGYLCPYFSFLEIEVLMADHKERERALSWGSVLKDAHFVLFHEAISKDFTLNLRKKIRTEQITDGIRCMICLHFIVFSHSFPKGKGENKDKMNDHAMPSDGCYKRAPNDEAKR